MSTISKSILPIPESVVVGSGSYTVPANKYGYLSASVRASATHTCQSTSSGGSSAATASCSNQWIVAGSTVSVSLSSTGQGAAASGAILVVTSSSTVNINGSAFLSCESRIYTYGNLQNYSTAGAGNWSISLFPIPKNNLPATLIE